MTTYTHADEKIGFQIRIEKRIYKFLRQECVDKDTSMNAIINKLVAKYYEKQTKKT